MVNRIWQQHFGKGIVATPSNFGTRGAAATHPHLLDWLAHEFVAGGWSVKSLHRAIMLSRTYQMSSTSDRSGIGRPIPENRLYWRFDRRRLDAEIAARRVAVGCRARWTWIRRRHIHSHR